MTRHSSFNFNSAQFYALFAVLLLWPVDVLAGTLGAVIVNTVASSSLLPGLFGGASYLFGIVLGVLGIAKLYEHVQNPAQVPIWDALKRFLTGGAFLALPMVMEAAYVTLAANIDELDNSEFNTGGISDGGLDAVVARLMGDIWQPMGFLIAGFGYLAGIIFIMIGIMRLMKGMQDGVQGPGGIGTIMTFLVGGALFSLDAMMGAWSTSMFGNNQVATDGALVYTAGMTDAEVGHVHTVIASVIAFMMVIGWVSFVRGLFILRAVSDGNQQASMMAAFTHMFGGALAINLGPLLNAVQATLQIAQYGLNFT
jgi:hypothetical protein